MHQLYRLLRNNKETGPFSLEELADNDLSPSDLIWVEGKSINWKHPNEIEELVSFFESPQNDIEQHTPNEKEYYYPISTLSNYAVTDDERSKEKNSFSLKEISPDTFPITNEVLFQREEPDSSHEEIESLPQRSNINREHLYPETSWEYVPVKKRKRHLQLLPLFFIGLLLLIATFMFFFNDQSIKNNAGEKVASGNINKNPVPQTNQPPEISSVTKEADENFNNQTAPNNPAHHQKLSVKSGSSISTYTVSKHKDFHEPNLKNQKNNQDKTRIQQIQSDAGKIVQSGHTSPSKSESQSMPEQQVFSLYGMHPATHRQGVEAFKLTITNNSDVLRFAAVDVFYKKNGQLTNKETLYFKNIAPHQSVTLTAPANQAADDVSYKLGLVSNENGAIYVGN